MQDFLDIVLPPLLLLILVTVTSATVTCLITARVRLWNAQRRRLDDTRELLTASRILMIDIINDAALDDELRHRTINLYDQINSQEELKK